MLQQKDYFEVFNLKPQYTINHTKLKEKYYDLTKKYHPDIFHDNNKFQLVTKAYNVLKNDYARAVYLRNKPIIKSPSINFLTKILDLEEQVMMAGNLELEKLKDEVEKQIRVCRNNYDKEEYLVMWKYYDRLLKMIENKM